VIAANIIKNNANVAAGIVGAKLRILQRSTNKYFYFGRQVL
jgi:hypothetical protein